MKISFMKGGIKVNIDKTKKQKNLKSYYEITEIDFYPPEDTRLFKSGISDIDDGDNFEDYSKWFYDNYENEIFDN